MNVKATMVASALLLAPAAMAQDTGAASMSQDTAPAAAASSSGGRFRFGINANGGLESVSSGGASASATMFGVDLRLGYQINDMFAVYTQPHLSFGTFGGLVGSTSTFTGTVMGEATFADRFFVGAGVGYGVLNNPKGPAFEARGGFYPLMGHGDDGVRRKGLMVGVDVRTVLASQDGVSATGLLFMGCIGYEAF